MSAHRARTRRAPLRLVLAGALALGGLTLLAGSPAVADAVSSSTNTAAGTGACVAGTPTNCNSYAQQEDVWLSGLPSGATLDPGVYFFAVLSPGGQPNPNDLVAGVTNPKLLSEDGRAARTFTVNADGSLDYVGPHGFEFGKLQVSTFTETPNNGGVYALAVCRLAGPDAVVKASDCKYDNFKVADPDPGTGPRNPLPLQVVKTAVGAYTATYPWSLAKSVDKTQVQQVGGQATFNYAVSATKGAPSYSDVTVDGVITVSNFNDEPVTGVDVADTLSDGTSCVVTDGQGATIDPGTRAFGYHCALTSRPQSTLDNTATATWAEQDLAGYDTALAGDVAAFTFSEVPFTVTTVGSCIAVSDTFNGGTATSLSGDLCDSTGSTPLIYSKTVPVPASGCATYDNLAAFTVVGSTVGGTSNTVTVTVCGPEKTGARTIGFWGNNNGQGIIKAGQAPGGVCSVGTYLRTLAPFADVKNSCADVASYYLSTFTAGTKSTSSMAAMLKVQMLATALDVYFTGPGAATIPAKYVATIGGQGALGAVDVDLTKICRPGVSPCTAATWQDVSAAFGGATHKTVADMLTYSAGQYVSLTSWYTQSTSTLTKARQELAKNAYDAINNEIAFRYLPTP